MSEPRLTVPYFQSSSKPAIINGQVQKTATHMLNIGKDDHEHLVMMQFFEPSLDNTIREIAQEVAEMRMAGTLRPFREGEPIGVIPRRVKPRRPTEKQVRDFNNKLREWRREDMLKLRAKNDAIIREILSS